MALIKCSECGKEISSEAKVCPNCGKPLVIEQPIAQEDTSDCSKVAIISIGAILMIIGFFLLFSTGYSIGYGN